MLALPVNTIANVTLSSVKQVLVEVKRDCPAWFGLLHSHLILDTKGVLVVLGRGIIPKFKVLIPHVGS